ncbi:MAG TPA: hypothetical protein VNN09_04055 [Candidatus Competibacteraceae bacterium]|nr:hypothetical protein [Candidatus Competibacteraceae bacterium]
MSASHPTAILGALLPIFLLIALGYGLRRGDFPGAAFWPYAERLTYYLLLPALLVNELVHAELTAFAVGPLAVVVAGMLGGMSALLYGLKPLLGLSGAVFGSLYQGTIRFNTYVGLAAAAALFQNAGATVAAIVIAIMIPLVNVLCVAVLTHAQGGLGLRGLLASLARNPLIVACVLGAGLNLSGLACRSAWTER